MEPPAQSPITRRRGADTPADTPRRIQENKAISRTITPHRRTETSRPRILFLIHSPSTAPIPPRTLPRSSHTFPCDNLRLRQHHHRPHQRHRRLYGRNHRPRHWSPHNDNCRRTQTRGHAILINGLCSADDPSTQKPGKGRRIRDLHRQRNLYGYNPPTSSTGGIPPYNGNRRQTHRRRNDVKLPDYRRPQGLEHTQSGGI